MAATVGRIQIKVTPDTKGFKQAVKAETAGIDDVKLKLDIDTAFLRQKIAAATQGITAKIDLEVNRSSLDRFQQSIAGMQMPSIGGGGGGALTGGLGMLGNPAVLVAGIGLVVQAISPLIALFTAASLAAGGLVGTLGAIAGPIALGFDGIKEAAKSIEPEFTKLKETISTQFAEGLTPVFEKLTPLINSLGTSMTPVVNGLTKMADSFVTSITSAGNMESIQNIFNNIGSALEKAGPGIDGFVSGLLKLTENFSGGALDGIVGFFNKIGTSFGDWITKMDESGKLDDMFSDLGGTLETIGGSLGDIVTKSIEWFEGKGPEDLMQGLKQVGSIIEGIVSVSNFLSNTFALWAGIGPAIAAGWNGVLGVFSAIGNFGAAIWQTIVTAAQVAWQNVMAVVQGAISAIGGIVSGIGGTLSGAWSSLVSGAQGAWNALVGVARTIMTAVAGAFRSGVSACGDAMRAVGTAIVDAAKAIIGQMEAIGRDIINGIASGIRGAAGAVKAAVESLLGLIPDWARKIMGIASPSKVMAQIGIQTVDGLVKGIDESTLAAAKASAEAGDEIGRAFADALKDAMKDIPDEMKGVTKDAGDGATKEADKSNEELKKLFGAAWDFGDAQLDAIRGDLNIGGGAITAALDQALGWAKTTVPTQIFQVTNEDTALSLSQRKANQAKLQNVGRGVV